MNWWATISAISSSSISKSPSRSEQAFSLPCRQNEPQDEHARSPNTASVAAALAEAEELCVCDLAWIVECSQNLVSHDLRPLRTTGVVGSRRDGKMVLYRITDEGRALLDVVLGTAITS